MAVTGGQLKRTGNGERRTLWALTAGAWRFNGAARNGNVNHFFIGTYMFAEETTLPDGNAAFASAAEIAI